jgi:hypothetical protein
MVTLGVDIVSTISENRGHSEHETSHSHEILLTRSNDCQGHFQNRARTIKAPAGLPVDSLSIDSFECKLQCRTCTTGSPWNSPCIYFSFI